MRCNDDTKTAAQSTQPTQPSSGLPGDDARAAVVGAIEGRRGLAPSPCIWSSDPIRIGGAAGLMSLSPSRARRSFSDVNQVRELLDR